VAATNVPTAASHPFYRRLNQLLREHGFDAFVEAQCAGFYAATIGRASSTGWRGARPLNSEPSLNHDAGAGCPHNVCRRGSVSDQRIGA